MWTVFAAENGAKYHDGYISITQTDERSYMNLRLASRAKSATSWAETTTTPRSRDLHQDNFRRKLSLGNVILDQLSAGTLLD